MKSISRHRKCFLCNRINTTTKELNPKDEKYEGTTLRSGLEIMLVSCVYEILAVRLSDTGNEKNNIFNIT
jgi:hypothetical protein